MNIVAAKAQVIRQSLSGARNRLPHISESSYETAAKRLPVHKPLKELLTPTSIKELRKKGALARRKDT